jgi:hypothetical protein
MAKLVAMATVRRTERWREGEEIALEIGGFRQERRPKVRMVLKRIKYLFVKGSGRLRSAIRTFKKLMR